MGSAAEANKTAQITHACNAGSSTPELPITSPWRSNFCPNPALLSLPPLSNSHLIRRSTETPGRTSLSPHRRQRRPLSRLPPPPAADWTLPVIVPTIYGGARDSGKCQRTFERGLASVSGLSEKRDLSESQTEVLEGARCSARANCSCN